MELEDVQSDLHSLRKLYGLLQTSRDGLQNASSENLDEKARVLLKNLLDCATERVFETRSKIIAAQLGVLNMPHSTQSEQPRGIPRSKPPVSPNTLNISRCVVQNSSKDLNCPEFSLQKEKRSPTKPIPREMVLEQSKFSICASEPENRKKFRGFHNQSSMKKNLAKKTQISNRKAVPTKDVNNQVQFSHFHGSDGGIKGLEFKEKSVEPLRGHEKPRQLRGHEKPRQKRNREVLQCDPRNIKLLAASSRTLASGIECSLGTEIEKKPEDVDYISKEVTDTIKRIESYLPVVQQIDGPVDLFGDKNTAPLGLCEKKANSIYIADSDSPNLMERKKGLVSRAELSQAGKLGLAQNDAPSQQGIQRLRKPSDFSMLHQVMSPRHKSTSEEIDLLGLNKDKPKLPDRGGIEMFKPFQKSNSQLNQLVSRKGGKTKGSNLPANMMSPIRSPSTGVTNPQNQKTGLAPGQNIKAVVEKFELVNRLDNQNDPVPSPVPNTIQGFRISPSHKDEIVKEAPLPVKVLSQIQKENRDQNLMAQKGTIRKGVASRSLVTPQSVRSAKKIQAVHADEKLSQTRTREMIRKEKNLPPQMIVRPTLLDHYPSQRSLLPSTSYTSQTDIKGSGKQKHTYGSPHRRIKQPHHPQSEETTSSSCSSSSWTTQQTSSTCSESEGHEPLPSQAPLQTRRLGHAPDSTSLGKDDYSGGILPQYEHQDSSRRMTRTNRSGYQVNSQKAVGRLRRLKNKLAIIFHHHHHHHHHHHNDENEDTEAGHSRSLWKYVQKMFHPTSKEEAYGEEAVEKSRRSAVINAPRKQQGRHHLHAMVESLLRHIRNSKKSKAGGGGISLVGNGQHGNKKMGKKLHWWQTIGGHGGVKLPNRGRIKVGFRSKKPRLRAGKMK